MKRFPLMLLALATVAAGCTDSPESVSREYRNANNEAIDAMMMVVDDATAERMVRRIFKPLQERYDVLDKKLAAVEQNRDQKDFVKEVFESNGVHLYLTEIEVNRQRFILESVRLKAIHKQLKDAGHETPGLDELIGRTETLEPVRKQLTSPLLVTKMATFKTWKLGNFDELLGEFMERRRFFEAPKDLSLVK